MSRWTRARSAGKMIVGVVLAALVVGPLPVAGRAPIGAVAAPPSRSADLGRALAADGTFLGARGVAGTVDTSAWTLVSDLAAGEPPRFAPTGIAVATPIGPWSNLGCCWNGAGTGALNNWDFALTVSGQNLYVGGHFTNAAGKATADYLAVWNGSAWAGVGSNGFGDGALSNDVSAIAVSGSNVYVGGHFTNAAGFAAADYIARWNGSAWSAVGDDGSGGPALNGNVFALAVSGTDLYVGGYFSNAGGFAEADAIARWNGSAWSALGSNGTGNGAINCCHVDALAVSGTDLYVGGWFQIPSVPGTSDIAKWNGSVWSSLDGVGLNGSVYALAVSGTGVYVGGGFTDAGSINTADYVAKWTGSSWAPLGSNGAGNGALYGATYALAVSGSDVYVGGHFFDAAGIPEADFVAMWNGSAWSALGSDGSGNGPLNNSGCCGLAVSSKHLYVGGQFTDAAGIALADYIAQWALIRKPDGRVRLGTGTYVGNNIYNTTGTNQTRSGSATPGHSVTFGISIQNDGNGSDRFKVKATGAAVAGYTVKYFRGTTDISAAVVAGTYKTTSVAAAGTYVITATVTVKSTAVVGSQVTRLVTLTSVGNSTNKDAVKFIGKRA